MGRAEIACAQTVTRQIPKVQHSAFSVEKESIMVDVSKWTVTKDWENPAIYERNRARMHVPLRSYKTKDAALRYFTEGPSRTDRRSVDLNSTTGVWKFTLFDKPENVVPDFWERDFNDKPWSSVRLPFCDENSIFNSLISQSKAF
jgi:hypothetical protein